jgi:hypothetical protein
MKEQQRVDPELVWVVRWRETGEELTEGELFIGPEYSRDTPHMASPVISFLG